MHRELCVAIDEQLLDGSVNKRVYAVQLRVELSEEHQQQFLQLYELKLLAEVVCVVLKHSLVLFVNQQIQSQ